MIQPSTPLRRKSDDRKVRPGAGELFEDIEAVHVRHMHVENHAFGLE